MKVKDLKRQIEELDDEKMVTVDFFLAGSSTAIIGEADFISDFGDSEAVYLSAFERED